MAKDEEYRCDRLFCFVCISLNYDMDPGAVSSNTAWICPFCQNMCYCSRCMRQEQIAKLRALFVSLGGLSADLENSANLLNAYAAANMLKARELPPPAKKDAKVFIDRINRNVAGKRKDDWEAGTQVAHGDQAARKEVGHDEKTQGVDRGGKGARGAGKTAGAGQEGDPVFGVRHRGWFAEQLDCVGRLRPHRQTFPSSPITTGAISLSQFTT